MTAAAIACYGRTYWDVEVEVDLASLGTGKGKRDVPVQTVVGGWAFNAAGAAAARVPAGAVRVVTVANRLDWPRLQAHLPSGAVLDAIDSGEGPADWPAVSVIINPAGACRLLRDPLTHTDGAWRLEAVPAAALAARLHLCGRLPAPFVAGLLAHARPLGGRVAWVGGATCPPSLEQDLDVLCVNTAEANRLCGTDGADPEACARRLAERATAPGAVRVVTGRDAAPTTAAVRDGDAVRCVAAPPPDVPRAAVRRLKGAGDTFAAVFLTVACVDDAGRTRDPVAVAEGLQAAAAATARFIRQVDA